MFFHRCLCFIFYQTTIAREQKFYNILVMVIELKGVQFSLTSYEIHLPLCYSRFEINFSH